MAVKYEGASSAFAFSAWSYFHGGPDLFADPRLELLGDEYRITVQAKAGGAVAVETLRLRNYGTGVHGFQVVGNKRPVGTQPGHVDSATTRAPP